MFHKNNFRLFRFEIDKIRKKFVKNACEFGPRSADTVHVFYMKSGQKGAEEILNNVVRSLRCVVIDLG